MGQFKLAGATVLRGTVTMPRAGAWVADLVLDGEVAPTGAQTLTPEAGTPLAGTVRTSAPYAGSTYVRLVGGADGLWKSPPAKAFRQVPLSTVLRDTLGAVGEALAGSSDAGVVGRQVAAYARVEAPAAHALAFWAGEAGVSWRVLADGSVWLGSDVYGAVSLDEQVVGDAPERRARTLATERLELLPGTTVSGRKVDSAIYTIGQAVRVEVLYVE